MVDWWQIANWPNGVSYTIFFFGQWVSSLQEYLSLLAVTFVKIVAWKTVKTTHSVGFDKREKMLCKNLFLTIFRGLRGNMHVCSRVMVREHVLAPWRENLLPKHVLASWRENTFSHHGARTCCRSCSATTCSGSITPENDYLYV